jgi:serine/threonine protein kinase
MSARFEPLAEALVGGYARVQRVRDAATGAVVALKRPIHEGGEAARQFAMEIQVLGEVQHPHLIRLLDHGRDEQGLFAVLEWLDGESLEARLSRAPLAAAMLRPLLLSLAAALQALHAAGYAHGDVNASNVMLAEDCCGRLIDLGNAVLLGQPAQELTGSIHSMAPELFDQAPRSAATDWYALGVMAYQALCGQLPFEGETRAQVIAAHHRHWRVPLQERAVVPQDLAELIEGLISRTPKERVEAARRLFLACSPAASKEP